MRLFTPLFILTFILFMGIFAVVVFTAFARPSGRIVTHDELVVEVRACSC